MSLDRLLELNTWWTTYCTDNLPSKSKNTLQYWPQITKLFLIWYPDDNTGKFKTLEHHNIVDTDNVKLPSVVKVKFRLKYKFGKNGICDLWSRPWGDGYKGFTSNYALYYPLMSKWLSTTEKKLEELHTLKDLDLQDIRLEIKCCQPEVVIDYACRCKLSLL